MPLKKTIQKARKDKKAGKSVSTHAGVEVPPKKKKAA